MSEKSEESSSSPLRRVVGMIAHTELASTNPEATREFLTRVFDWRFQSADSMEGELIPYETPGGTTGSIRKTHPEEPPASMNYVRSRILRPLKRES